MTSHNITFIKNKLNAISPSFCAAKWQQVSIHLQNGQTHSCHHPAPHKIPLDELENNPSALHNTSFKKLQRKKMLEGERPSECDYCWRIEDSSPDSISDRVYKSAATWSESHIDTIAQTPWDADVDPSYIEVAFSNVCNFKCSYCSPHASSKWTEEIERFGPYPTTTQFGNIQWLKRQNMMPIPHKDYNPYVEAFWKWWPDMSQKLEHFRITGGEPLLTKDTFDILDYVIETPHPNLQLSINTNLCVPEALFSKFIEKVKIICNEKKVQKFRLFTSADTVGEQAEYLRHGLDYTAWLANIRRVLDEVPEVSFTIMSTYNALSIFKYHEFLKDILDIKMEYVKPGMTHPPIMVDSPYLRWPQHQAIFILPRQMVLDNMQVQIDFVKANMQDSKRPYLGFFEIELEKLERIYQMIASMPDVEHVTTEQQDFVAFVDEHDKRRGTNFLQTFPEMADLYAKWKGLPVPEIGTVNPS